MDKLKVLVNGCTGKMGKEVIDCISENSEFEVLCGFCQKEVQNFPFPVYRDINSIKLIPDVIIDFSVPVATFSILDFAKENKIPMVIATTGFSEEELSKIKEYAKYIPIFLSSNMSFDICLMQKVLATLAQNLPNTDIEIVETHHNRKIDSPSGTALMLADSINQACENKYTYNFSRLQERKPRETNEIGFSSIRGGNIVGEHTVKFMGADETFEITHTCYSRKVFANGALKAAKFLVTQKNGFYNMNDLL